MVRRIRVCCGASAYMPMHANHSLIRRGMQSDLHIIYFMIAPREPALNTSRQAECDESYSRRCPVRATRKPSEPFSYKTVAALSVEAGSMLDTLPTGESEDKGQRAHHLPSQHVFCSCPSTLGNLRRLFVFHLRRNLHRGFLASRA